MLVCNVSLLARRASIAAELVEAATAVDATATGNVVFATLVDDPASVRDRVDAYLGEIMLEAASAAAAVNAGMVFGVSIVEAANAAELFSGSVPTVWSAAVVEAATASSTQDAAIVAMVGRAAKLSGIEPVSVNPGAPLSSRLKSGTTLGA
jgi:hypothetical protein